MTVQQNLTMVSTLGRLRFGTPRARAEKAAMDRAVTTAVSRAKLRQSSRRGWPSRSPAAARRDCLARSASCA